MFCKKFPAVKKADFRFILIVDWKVVSTPTIVKNGAIASSDFLELPRV